MNFKCEQDQSYIQQAVWKIATADKNIAKCLVKWQVIACTVIACFKRILKYYLIKKSYWMSLKYK